MPIQVLPEGRYLPERDGHRIWWCETGLPGGIPVLVLHGGPGGRTRLSPLQWLEGLPVRCIGFDQRGCGRSEPAGRIEHNTLVDLVEDIEHLRLALGIETWHIVAGSWGALLAVAYAAAHPARTAALFLRSAFLGSDAEVARFFAPWPTWLGNAGAAWLGVTDAADPVRLLDSVSGREGGSVVSPGRVAWAWQAFERAQARAGGLSAWPNVRFEPPPRSQEPVSDAWPAGATVQWHYLRHHCFVQPLQVQTWLDALSTSLIARPVMLVHGLKDEVCPPQTTETLAARWPQAVVRWVPEGGHDMDAPVMRDALSAAVREWVAHSLDVA